MYYDTLYYRSCMKSLGQPVGLTSKGELLLCVLSEIVQSILEGSIFVSLSHHRPVGRTGRLHRWGSGTGRIH